MAGSSSSMTLPQSLPVLLLPRASPPTPVQTSPLLHLTSLVSPAPAALPPLSPLHCSLHPSAPEPPCHTHGAQGWVSSNTTPPGLCAMCDLPGTPPCGRSDAPPWGRCPQPSTPCCPSSGQGVRSDLPPCTRLVLTNTPHPSAHAPTHTSVPYKCTQPTHLCTQVHTRAHTALFSRLC